MIGQILSMFLGDGESTLDSAILLCARIFVLLCCIPVHESAHAWMAAKLGDHTGRLSGRITLNPFAHISGIGALMILLFGFGYAKPVPVNIRNFKKRKDCIPSSRSISMFNIFTRCLSSCRLFSFW